jgi:transketolase
VAETLFDARLSRPLERVGLPDQFIECGSVPFLRSKYGLTPEHIVKAAQRSLARGE